VAMNRHDLEISDMAGANTIRLVKIPKLLLLLLHIFGHEDCH
jgi:hypothetical protein